MVKRKSKKQAKEEIEAILKKAVKTFSEDKAFSDKMVKKARRIAMKHQISLPISWKRRICKHCHSMLFPGRNLRIRNHDGHMVYYCLECKRFMRFPHKKK